MDTNMKTVNYLRPVSDLHLERRHNISGNYLDILPTLPTDNNTALVLLGDICSPGMLPGVLSNACERFADVLFIPGNHDYWGSSIPHVTGLHQKLESQYANLSIAIPQLPINLIYEVNGLRTKLIGSTLWAIGGNNPLNTLQLQNCPDFHEIENFSPEDMHVMNKLEEQQLYAALDHGADQTIMMTHYVPGLRFLNSYIKRSVFDNIFYSEQYALFPRVDLWLFGHTHEYIDEQDELWFRSNPHGGGQKPVKGFDPTFVIDLSKQLAKLI
jgi:predicted phosphohydrolase